MGKNSWKRFQSSGSLKPLCYAMRGMLMALFVKHSFQFNYELPLDIKLLIDMAIPYLPDSLDGKNALGADIKEAINMKRQSERATGLSAKPMQAFIEYMLHENHPDMLTLSTDAAIKRSEIELPQIFRTVLKHTWQKAQTVAWSCLRASLENGVSL